MNKRRFFKILLGVAFVVAPILAVASSFGASYFGDGLLIGDHREVDNCLMVMADPDALPHYCATWEKRRVIECLDHGVSPSDMICMPRSEKVCAYSTSWHKTESGCRAEWKVERKTLLKTMNKQATAAYRAKFGEGGQFVCVPTDPLAVEMLSKFPKFECMATAPEKRACDTSGCHLTYIAVDKGKIVSFYVDELN